MQGNTGHGRCCDVVGKRLEQRERFVTVAVEAVSGELERVCMGVSGYEVVSVC